MTTKQIDYCIELAHTLNFSKAAENCFASQPTFSYQMNLLENEVGLPLNVKNAFTVCFAPTRMTIGKALAHL